ncbi:hypothetical protein OTB20_32730 [Streptomyces sp. H27-H1]|uniref:DUF6197 family protein n=1 Tax=Streptomyces sp. H27-H1 TaxID=2996461 RepID=UPI0022715A92|nr:hypothetical protein [Streptomyces sp. H27-H1]MCY0930876.1 hypothetical protein [Streptomyces sp. H27-H1]
MNTNTTVSGFTPVEHDLYAQAFRLLDPAPTPAPGAAAPPPAVAPAAPVLQTVLPTGAVERTLADGLRFLDTHGWVQRSLIHPGGARCSIGALRAAAGARTPAYQDAGNLLLDEARRQHGKQWTALPSWNDSHTRGQVRSVWEAAIRRAHRMNI